MKKIPGSTKPSRLPAIAPVNPMMVPMDGATTEMKNVKATMPTPSVMCNQAGGGGGEVLSIGASVGEDEEAPFKAAWSPMTTEWKQERDGKSNIG
mmetsp:Transcript_59111/g.80738  ORF Transcript_59111/g.80738 Transcript_59111/m.80738 type:complete len:95 (-) Transcript_59111:61-345(-)